MRAILLVKDKEGLNEDRLQNSRYGLTGKPTLAQQGIAGSLSASFKAGQQVTVSNLRSLNDKLREAQKALDNANNNIDQVDQTQDKMDDAKDEVNRLLSTGLWEKLWNGTITPFEFYAGKYAEDTSNEAMAGEPGFPVQNIGEVMSAPPIPRLQYWDPFAKFGGFRIIITESDDYAYVSEDSDYRIYVTTASDSLNSLKRFMAANIGLASTMLFNAVVIAGTAYSNFITFTSGPGAAWMSAAAGVYVALIAVILGLVTNLLERTEITDLGGYDVADWISSPTCYYAGKTHIRSLLTDKGLTTSSIFTATSLGVLIAYQGVIIGLIAATTALLSNPFTLAAAFSLGAAATTNIWILTSLMMASLSAVATQFVMLCNCAMNRRLLGYDSDHAYKEESGPDVSNSTLGYVSDKAGVDNNVSALTTLSTIVSLGITLAVSSQDTSGNAKPPVYLGYDHNRNSLSTEVVTRNNDSGILTPFDSWWSSPIVNVNLNDVADGTLVGGPIQQPTFLGRVNTESRIRSQVFKGDYFGLQKGIKLLEGRIITNTVVVRAKLTANDYIYYACGVLVTTNTTGNQLHLLWERNAIYDFNENTSMPQVEQMIYNYDHTSLPVKDFFTSNRTGRLQYIYGKFKTGKGESTFQLRNVQRAWPNYLNGQLINTEYTFGPMTVLSSGPRCTWGDLSSYMYL